MICEACKREVDRLASNSICIDCPEMKRMYSLASTKEKSKYKPVKRFNKKPLGRSGKIERLLDHDYVDNAFKI